MDTNMMKNTTSLNAIQRSFNLWLRPPDRRIVVSAVSAFFALTTPQPKFDRGNSNVWYYYTASIFSLGLFLAFLGHSSAKSTEKKALSKVLFMVNFIAVNYK